jgi:hypothetical protein
MELQAAQQRTLSATSYNHKLVQQGGILLRLGSVPPVDFQTSTHTMQ